MLNPSLSHTPSLRAEIVTRRSYNRPLNEEGTRFETWEQTVTRVIRHQRWLWERAKRKDLDQKEESELDQLKMILLKREGCVAGRTLWLGGTDIAKKRAGSQFNCTAIHIKTVYDLVDVVWFLLQGCFSGDTLVQMADGSLRPISDIKEGDQVVSYNETTQQYAPQTVSKVHRNPVKPMVRVTTETGHTLVCTADHLFMTDNGWIEAQYLSGCNVVNWQEGETS